MQLRRCYNNLRSKGSITVEACVILPVFLSVFFLLLFLVKFTCTGMVLDYAVNEAAKEIAATAYPISFINELEDEKIGEYGNVRIPTPEEELEKLINQIGSGSSGNMLNVIISGDLKGTDIADALKGVLEDYSKGIIGGIIDRITPAYWDMKSAGKYMIADALIKEHLDNPLINGKNARLRLVEFPQGKEEYNARSASSIYEKLGLAPGKDFNRDDVVLQLEYDYKVNLPFVENFNVKMVHTAVERAWLNGSFGVLTSKEEGLDLEPEGDMVFITRTGIRYHRGSCWHLRKSRIPIERGEAEEKGYTPCKVCKPLN
ncbi:MAG: TadE/TadG family type IV pilus assembly protein [Clostridiaceae bacterium]|nr:TadE/TadG family type IV pilus assembly protein [Clostridiaceae bacterium]